MPSASERMATLVTKGVLNRVLRAKRTVITRYRRITERKSCHFVVLSVDALWRLHRRPHGKKDSEEENGPQTECGFHEAGDPERHLGADRRCEADAADRGHEKALGLYQEEWSAGQEEPPPDQRRRQAQGRVRWRGQREHVCDDEAGEQAPEISSLRSTATVLEGDGRVTVAFSFLRREL